MMESTRQNTFTLLKTLFIVSAIVLIFILPLYPVCTIAGQYKVVRVTDGDTIKVKNNSQTNIIRLVGIDSPETSEKKNETGQPFSRKSTKYLSSLVLNKPVKVQSYGTDRYGRTLGVAYFNSTNINLEMVKAGLSEVYRGRPAREFDNDLYLRAEKEAREADRGMWSLGDRYVSPREWRRTQR